MLLKQIDNKQLSRRLGGATVASRKLIQETLRNNKIDHRECSN